MFERNNEKRYRAECLAIEVLLNLFLCADSALQSLCCNSAIVEVAEFDREGGVAAKFH